LAVGRDEAADRNRGTNIDARGQRERDRRDAAMLRDLGDALDELPQEVSDRLARRVRG